MSPAPTARPTVAPTARPTVAPTVTTTPRATLPYVVRSPVAYWRLDDPTTAVARDQTGVYDGRFEGNPSVGRPGLIGSDEGSSVRFDGLDDRLVADAVANRGPWSAFSLEVWAEVTQTDQEEHAVAFSTVDGEYAPAILRDEPTDHFKYRDGDGVVESSTVPQPGSIYHVVVAVAADGGGVLYVNGAAEGTFTTSVRPPDGGLFTIGAEYDADPLTVTSHWHGRLDEVAVYDYALSASEVRAHWRAGSD